MSVLYDIQAGGRVYNLQAGYEESFHHKLSLGTLHLGYAIEQAFQVSSISRYDLLQVPVRIRFIRQDLTGTGEFSDSRPCKVTEYALLTSLILATRKPFPH